MKEGRKGMGFYLAIGHIIRSYCDKIKTRTGKKFLALQEYFQGVLLVAVGP